MHMHRQHAPHFDFEELSSHALRVAAIRLARQPRLGRAASKRATEQPSKEAGSTKSECTNA
jgi:hypothetical protein